MARYITGALNLLRNVETIDWPTLYCGEICMDEVQRVYRIARRDIISLPSFLNDVDKYRKQLRQIAVINGLDPYCSRTAAALNVELPVPKQPRNRQRSSAKLSVTRTSRLSTSTRGTSQAIPAPLPAVIGVEEDTDKVAKIYGKPCKDKLPLTESVTQVASFQLMSKLTAAKRLKECERSASVNGISLALKRFNFKPPLNLNC